MSLPLEWKIGLGIIIFFCLIIYFLIYPLIFNKRLEEDQNQLRNDQDPDKTRSSPPWSE